MANIPKGATSVYNGVRARYTPGLGYTYTYIYHFSNSADANAFAASQAALNTNVVEIDDRAPSYTVEISSPTAEGGTGDDVVDIYELPPLDTEKDVTESPAFQALSATDQSILRAYGADKTEANYQAAIDFPVTGASLAFLELMRRGTDSVVLASQEFRWTRIVSDAGLPAASAGAFDSVAERYTNTQLVNSIGGLPGAWATAITNSYNAHPDPGDTTNYHKSWLKMQSNIVRRGSNRNELTLRWVLGNWSKLLYADA